LAHFSSIAIEMTRLLSQGSANLAVNLSMARTLGPTIPPSLLAGADEVIE
jgi:hypothetical protein